MRACGARPSIHPSIPEMAAAVQAIRKQKRESLAAERVVNVFLKYDSDGSGAIDKEELMSALRELGMSVTGVHSRWTISSACCCKRWPACESR